jgi:peptide subunit release factor 1 (eRF1)
VVQHPSLDREALVLIQADSKTRRILNITDHSITKLFGVYITNLRANPQLNNVEYIDEPEITNPTFYFTWNKAIDFFKMPKEVRIYIQTCMVDAFLISYYV